MNVMTFWGLASHFPEKFCFPAGSPVSSYPDAVKQEKIRMVLRLDFP